MRYEEEGLEALQQTVEEGMSTSAHPVKAWPKCDCHTSKVALYRIDYHTLVVPHPQVHTVVTERGDIIHQPSHYLHEPRLWPRLKPKFLGTASTS